MVTPLFYLDFPNTVKMPRARRISRSLFLVPGYKFPGRRPAPQSALYGCPDNKQRVRLAITSSVCLGRVLHRLPHRQRLRKSRFEANSTHWYAALRTTHGADIQPWQIIDDTESCRTAESRYRSPAKHLHTHRDALFTT
jgi:hypothetical protein